MTEELVKRLKVVLSDTFSLYLKTHTSHWNITGKNFYGIHKFLQKQYEELWNSVDRIAETIRTLNVPVPGNYTTYGKLSNIKTEETCSSVDNTINMLIKDHQTAIDDIYKAFEEAEKINDQAVMNVLADRLEQHKIHIWKLTAHL